MMNRPPRIKDRQGRFTVPIMSAREAAALIPDGATVTMVGAGGGICEPTELINALADRYRESGSPKDLTLFHSCGMGDRADRGMSPLAQEGLAKRIYGGHWDQSPRLAQLADQNKVEAYNYPMGVMCHMLRAAAAGLPGVISRIGIGTFEDPRQQGGRLNSVTTEETLKLLEIDGKEYIYYPTVPLDVAFIRGTSIDSEGYLTMEDEVTWLDVAAVATATHNNGGLVIAQVQRVVEPGSLHPRDVKVPGYMIDVIVEVPEQPQMFNASINRFISGDFRVPDSGSQPLPLDQRKVVARRAMLEIQPGDVGNLGVGIADGIGSVAREEGVDKEFTLTVETGPIGGITAQGIFFGASINTKALLDMPSMFDFYDGGGLNVCFLSFAEVDAAGDVNVHRFNGKIVGTGGFINICQGSRKCVFCGTLTAGGLKTEIKDNKLHIVQEGKFKKFVSSMPELTFNGAEALKNGQEVIYVTERAVFRLTEGGLMLMEYAPGIDVKKDILDKMEFSPLLSPELKEMDLRLFNQGPMGIDTLEK